MSDARDAASLRQVQASDPGASVWLSANAGSGKTKVLTDRVARLLLAGTPPHRILCLTYTKAAAGEMQNRLFGLLGRWAMAPDAALAADLAALGEAGAAAPGRLRAARRLFAQAVETPGGLKIQTIHAFAAALLRRFPLEAGVSPGFAELDDRAARLMRADLLEALAREDPGALDALEALAGAGDVEPLLTALAARRTDFARPLSPEAARELFGLAAGFDAAALLAEVFLGGEAALLADLCPVLAEGSIRDGEAAAKLAGVLPDPASREGLEVLEGVLLFGASAKAPFAAKLGAFPTRDTRGRLGGLAEPLEALMRRVEAARPRRLALAAAERTAELHRFAGAFLPRYAAAKAALGRLDFDDLILAAGRLLADPGRAAWVLWRLDGGIDHILVDEAQDTSPAQWALVESLTAEMTAGEGARGPGRTLFVVGDKKQSIYSFQGADLAAFDATEARFAARLRAAPVPMLRLVLEHSFRSSPAILRVVDLTFDERRGAGLGGEVKHLAFREAMPGRVDLWPVRAPPEKPAPGRWFEPVDMVPEDAATVVLARTLAAAIRRLIEAGTAIPTPQGARALTPGDILILVRRRSELFAELIRACKAEGLAVAGADRLKVGAELAVKDLAALLSFLATPEDDLSLAAALRSPLLGWSERELYALARPRPGYLWEALRGQAAAHPATLALLTDLRDAADFLRPYDLIERALTRHDGRRRLLARLGPEAEDGIDAFLAQALAYERSEVPSLTGFLGWMETDDLEVKRQLDAAGDRIRVMTVHGAKGLEAPVVILPDTADHRPPNRDLVLPGPDGTPLVRAAAEGRPPLLAAAAEAEAARAAAEALRLLYVAMTRAQSWLIVAAAGEVRAADGWYRRIEAGVEAAGAVAIDTPLGPGRRHAHGAWPAAAPPPAAAATAGFAPLPAWARTPPAPPVAAAPPLSPSDLGGAKALPGEGLPEEAARRRGTALHRLLEHLPLWPPETRAARAADLFAGAEDAPDPADLPGLLAEAARVLDAPALAPLFAPDALAEVVISAALPELDGRRILGQIDRLLVGPDRVLAVDYKSNALVPARPEAVPEGLLRQMGAYAAALAHIYPGRRVETALLWTRTAGLMPLPAALVRAALRRAALDAAGGRP